jgi:hypothetical protein
MFALSFGQHGFKVLDCNCSQALATDRVNGAVSIFAMGEKLDSGGNGHRRTTSRVSGIFNGCRAKRLCNNWHGSHGTSPLNGDEPTKFR